MNRRLGSGSRANRDRRDQAFARAVVAEATRRHNISTAVRDEIEVCPDCLGLGEVARHVDDTHVTEQICLECHGTGWVK